MSQAGRYGAGGGGAGDIETLTGDSGGAVSPDGAGNINVLGGTNVTVAGNPGMNTLTIQVTGDNLTWNEVTGTSESMLINNGYIANNVALVSLDLPVSASVGDIIRVTGKGAGGWTIVQNANQQIFFGDQSTTVGITGGLTSTSQRDTCALLCITDNLEFNVISSIGNLTVD